MSFEEHRSSPTRTANRSDTLPELDCLRGVAILLVVLLHVSGTIRPNLGGPTPEMFSVRSLVGGGHTGVSLFFVLSAFCLSLPMFRRGAHGFSLPEFFRRRALRILPAYWTAVAVAALVAAPAHGRVLTAAPYLIFAQALPNMVEPIPGFSYVWWSLATEVQFYLLLPLLPFALTSRVGRWIGTCLLVAYSGWYVLYVAGKFPLGADVREYCLSQSVLGRGPLFLLGLASAWTYVHHGSRIAARMNASEVLRKGGSDLLLLASLSALAVLLSWVTATNVFRADVPPYVCWHIAEGLCWSAVLLLVLLSPLRSRTLLVNRPLAAVGLVSYSIYLVHMGVLDWILLPYGELGSAQSRVSDWEKLGMAILAVAVTLGVSSFTYFAIERPFLRRKDRRREERTGNSKAELPRRALLHSRIDVK